MNERPLPLLNTIFRLLTFRITGDELRRLDIRFLIVGFIGTWLVGMGRHWDSPDAELLQHLGIGSLAYVLALSLLLFLAGKALRPRAWSYRGVLTFVTLTSFPAALYAIPVERWTTIEVARDINLWFLLIVATYRVALYLMFMRRSAQLGIFESLIAGFLPILLIISAITIAGAEKIIVQAMAGLDRTPTAQDSVNGVLFMTTLLSFLLLPILAIVYGVLAWSKRRPGRDWELRIAAEVGAPSESHTREPARKGR